MFTERQARDWLSTFSDRCWLTVHMQMRQILPRFTSVRDCSFSICESEKKKSFYCFETYENGLHILLEKNIIKNNYHFGVKLNLKQHRWTSFTLFVNRPVVLAKVRGKTCPRNACAKSRSTTRHNLHTWTIVPVSFLQRIHPFLSDFGQPRMRLHKPTVENMILGHVLDSMEAFRTRMW